jgi:membrane-bound metal-dependent hydrolase YbcI (DUF457 family)
VVPGGPLDETAHLLTTLLVVWALGSRASQRWLMPALIGSVAIDLDHIPGRLGIDWLSAGTPRPYTHSLLMVAMLLLAALLWRRARDAFVGVALGVTIHLWRDLDDSGVSLLWPLWSRSFSLPYASYVAVMVAVIGIDAYRCRTRRKVGTGKTLAEAAGR